MIEVHLYAWTLLEDMYGESKRRAAGERVVYSTLVDFNDERCRTLQVLK